MKRVVLVGDGMADAPHESLRGLTPLRAAHTPVLDAIAAKGRCGRVQLTPEGFESGTDVCHLLMFGYPPSRFYTGRAAIEAVSLGHHLPASDGVCRMNLVTEGTDGVLEHFGAGYIESSDSRPLVEAIAAHLPDNVTLHFNDRFHHILHLPGRGEECDATTTSLPHQLHGQPVSQNGPSGPLADELLEWTQRARELLGSHPANAARVARGQRPANSVWFWSSGRAAALPLFGVTTGLRATLLTGVSVLRGIGRLTGMDVPVVSGMTASSDNDYDAQCAAAIDALERSDVVFVHIDSPDEAAHLGDVEGKVAAIEALDAKIAGPLVAALEERGEPFTLTVLPDHYTMLASGRHDASPVPWLHFDSARPIPGSLSFDEPTCDAGPVDSLEFFWQRVFGTIPTTATE